MIPRRSFQTVLNALNRQAAVVLIGPRQVGKTTLALALCEKIKRHKPTLYLDLEASEDRNRLAEPRLFLEAHEDHLVVLDEIHRMPEIFQELRGIIDQGRRKDKGIGRFLFLGSATLSLLKQTGESLAGRVEYVDMNPLDVLDVPATLPDAEAVPKLWLRGGFPSSFLAVNDESSLAMRRDFIRSYLERDVAQFTRNMSPDVLERLWIMLAYNQGIMLNLSKLASYLGVSGPTVNSYIKLFIGLLVVRRLNPYRPNVKKRLVKRPRIYVRDSGMVHALLGIENYPALARHPVYGKSWEGFVIETLLSVSPAMTRGSFYRTLAGAKIDLVLQLPGLSDPWAIEIKRSLPTTLGRGFYSAHNDLKPARSFVICPDEARFSVAENVEAIGLREMARLLLSYMHPKASESQPTLF